MVMKYLYRLVAILSALLALVGCAGKKASRTALLPNVSGKAGEIIVVIDRDSWEGDLGDWGIDYTIQYISKMLYKG